MKKLFSDPINRQAMLVLAAFVALPVAGCSKTVAREAKLSQGDKPRAVQKKFESPEAAVDALLAAFDHGDNDVLLDIFGHDHEKLIVVSDKVARAESLKLLSEKAAEYHALETADDGSQVLVIGDQQWPFPIPLVESEDGWFYDTDEGAEEIINRRIGRHELNAIEVCELYVAAQREYAAQDHDGDRVYEYAQRLGSTPGQRDGLYWHVDPESDEDLSPFGPLLADAAPYVAAAKASDELIPYFGYYFRILKRQGSKPPGGRYDYVINGNMIAGFALVAWPADYASSGIMTFVVSHQGDVFEKDLGEKTAKLAKGMTRYDPDDTWRQIEGN